MEKRDYYTVLGVSRTATAREIRTAYRKNALEFHPDRHATRGVDAIRQAETSFKELGEAYEVLSDPSNRQKYDSFGFNFDRTSGEISLRDITTLIRKNPRAWKDWCKSRDEEDIISIRKSRAELRADPQKYQEALDKERERRLSRQMNTPNYWKNQVRQYVQQVK